MKKVFKGMVNGQMFTSVEDYNVAIMEAVYAGKPVTSSVSYEEIEEKCECGCECGCKGNCNKLDDKKLSYFCPRYVAGTLTGDLEANEEELKKITNDLDARYDEFFDWLDNSEYCECVENQLIDRIVEVTSELEESAFALYEKNTVLKDRLKELQSQITQVEAELAILDQERRIAEDVTDYYSEIEKCITDRHNREDEQAPLAEGREKEPQKELSLYELFTNKGNALDNLLENIEPQLNENDKTEIKKYANDLVSQFNRLLRCF